MHLYVEVPPVVYMKFAEHFGQVWRKKKCPAKGLLKSGFLKHQLFSTLLDFDPVTDGQTDRQTIDESKLRFSLVINSMVPIEVKPQ